MLFRECNPLLRLYYTSRTVLFLACAFNELFFMSLYMMAAWKTPIVSLLGRTLSVWQLFALISAPICFFKQTMNVVQLVGAAKTLAQIDAKSKAQ